MNNSQNLLVSLNNGVRLIKFNRPSKKNAINGSMYSEITKILNEDATNDDVIVTVFTGAGSFYSSGNDLEGNSEFTEEAMRAACDRVVRYVDAFIDYPKLLIAVINGPAIGIAVTTLGLFDVVYASNKATFHTPFAALGLCAEGCSSYLFPRMMGKSNASQVLLLGRKITANEAFDLKLVSEVIPHEKLDELFTKLNNYAELPLRPVIKSKELINGPWRQKLREVNRQEMDTVYRCLVDGDFIEGYTKFLTRRGKL